jgi:flagellar basal-body rod modification protein FlgD
MAISNVTGLNQEQFLQLLTAQLQNQNPLEPVSDKDLISELSQVSSVNGIAQLNATFSQFLQLQQLSQGSSLIGRAVEFTSANGPASGVVTAVTSSNGSINLQIGDQSVPLSSITKVQAA